MGIRFLCPNGHKLNVKSYLAGKRGICPQCDAKFLVPKTSGSQADAIDESVADEPTEQTQVDTEQQPQADFAEPPPPPAPTVAATTAEVTTEAPPVVWHVRTATGEQFGPANTETMTGWVAEGRVAVDSWVWRTGWPDWKTGGQAITQLNVPPPDPTQTAPPAPEATPDADALPGADEPLPTPLPEPTSATAAYRTARQIRQERARRVTFFLGGIVVLLLAVLITVLVKNK